MSAKKTKDSPHWLHVIGLGEQGTKTLSPKVKTLLAEARHILGPKRLLAMLNNGQAQKILWKPPFSSMLEQVFARRGSPTIILASGDPNWFGIGASLARYLKPDEYSLHPAISSLQLAASRMKWPLQDVKTISLHGRSNANLARFLYPGAKILALTADHKTFAEVGQILQEQGYKNSPLTGLQNLGGTEEKKVSSIAKDAQSITVGDFYVLAIECVADKGSDYYPAFAGLTVAAFKHGGQITKPQVRAASIAALAPFPQAILWDIGAGSGSIAIEWMRASDGAKAICFEQRPNRCENIVINRNRLGVPDLEIIQGNALSAVKTMADNRAPDAIFMGGGIADEELFSVLWQALSPGGRFVANAVSLSGQSALFARQKIFGGELCSIAISALENIGNAQILRPALPVIQWVITKPLKNIGYAL